MIRNPNHHTLDDLRSDATRASTAHEAAWETWHGISERGEDALSSAHRAARARLARAERTAWEQLTGQPYRGAHV